VAIARVASLCSGQGFGRFTPSLKTLRHSLGRENPAVCLAPAVADENSIEIIAFFNFHGNLVLKTLQESHLQYSEVLTSKHFGKDVY
jgi:hypothetical protein